VRKECRVVRELLERTARVSSGAESRESWSMPQHAECRQLLLSYQRLDEVLAQEAPASSPRGGESLEKRALPCAAESVPSDRQKVLLQPAWVGTAAIVLVAFGAAALYLLPKGKETDHRFSPMVTAESAQRPLLLREGDCSAARPPWSANTGSWHHLRAPCLARSGIPERVEKTSGSRTGFTDS